jgi:sulfur-oxidizing protein SoxY
VKADTLRQRREILSGCLAAAALASSTASWAQQTPGSSGISVGLPPADSPIWRLMSSYADGRQIEATAISLDIPELVETGNSVPCKVRVDSPMTASQFVQSLTIFNELNPVTEVLEVRFTAANPVAEVETRIKLANSQWVVALAKTNDGRCFAQGRQVVVTLGSCVG